MSATHPDPRYWKRLYAIISWLGIALNTLFWTALLFAPRALLGAFHIHADPIAWAQLSGELLGLITIFYVPPALNVDYYRPHAWIGAAVARGSGFLLCALGVLCFGAPGMFAIGALTDLAIGAAQIFLLWRLESAEQRWGRVPAPSAAPEPAPRDPTAAAHWRHVYRWVASIGICANLLFVLPLLFVPHWMLAFLGVGGEPVLFAQLSGLLLGLVSAFYLPAIGDPDKYRLFAWLAIFPSRAAGVTMCFVAVVFLHAPEAFILGVLLDLPFAVAQTFILGALERAERGKGAATKPGFTWPRGSREALAVLAVLAVVGILGWHKLLREEPQHLANATFEEQFNHGSIGTEAKNGLPYWIWLTLPNIFPEYLPEQNGYASLGFPWEPGAELPIGFSRKKIGFDRVGINCAFCHTGSVLVPGEPIPRILVGGAAVTQDVLGYQKFLFQCAEDPRFEAGTLLAEIDRQTRLSLLDRFLYEYVLIPQTRKALQAQAKQWKWVDEPGRPEWGPGRIEPFNPVKLSILHDIDPTQVNIGSTIGTSDMEPLWQLGRKQGQAFHWDGLQTDLTEVFLSSAIGDGATPQSLPRAWLQTMQDTLATRQAPAWPFAAPAPEEVEAGRALFTQSCARCHGGQGAELAQVTPAATVGTDPLRAEMWTPEAAAAYNNYPKNHAGMFRHFRSTGGYVNVPLDGIWSRAPYLHNGSVPTLAALLEPEEKRPARFIRGLNEYDPEQVGYLWDPKAAPGRGYLVETNLPGNSNRGHSGPEYGTELKPEEKRALEAYLKTL